MLIVDVDVVSLSVSYRLFLINHNACNMYHTDCEPEGGVALLGNPKYNTVPTLI